VSHQGHPVKNHALFLGHKDNLRLFSCGKNIPIHFSYPQGMHSLQIPSNADQTPFTLNGVQPAQQKLPEPLHLFNDAKDSFHCGFACGINRFSFTGL